MAQIATPAVSAMTNKKQAIVMVHGMGEQRPMETLHSFVESVWTKDPAVQGIRTTSKSKEKVWTIPDDLAGLQELRRVSTPENKMGKRTDFYEFYWADLMQGTTLQHVWAWIRGLLIRPPNTVPGQVFVVWLILWVLVAALAFFACIYFLSFDFVRSSLCGADRGSIEEFICAFITWLSCYASDVNTISVSIMKFIMISGPVYIVIKKLRSSFVLNWKFIPAVILFFVAISVLNIMMDLIIHSGNFLIVLVSIIGAVVHSFLVKYFGDVARFVRATPENVKNRRDVRERGLALLKGLHQSGKYDRIVIVAHSQGTIVAYDLLSLLWSEIGPSSHNLPSKNSARALSDLDIWLGEVANGTKNWSLDEFQKYQRSISETLAAQHLQGGAKTATNGACDTAWLISDFVTVGSPLTHAEFLLAQNQDDLDRLIEQRALPVSPPQLEEDPTSSTKSFRYLDTTTGVSVPHHAAMFSTVRWTNIHDRANAFGFLFGDVISGPVGTVLGNKRLRATPTDEAKSAEYCVGISDQKVSIRRTNWLFPRLFTHTLYWKWHHKWDVKHPPHHIQALRKAVNINNV